MWCWNNQKNAGLTRKTHMNIRKTTNLVAVCGPATRPGCTAPLSSGRSETGSSDPRTLKGSLAWMDEDFQDRNRNRKAELKWVVQNNLKER